MTRRMFGVSLRGTPRSTPHPYGVCGGKSLGFPRSSLTSTATRLIVKGYCDL